MSNVFLKSFVSKKGSILARIYTVGDGEFYIMYNGCKRNSSFFYDKNNTLYVQGSSISIQRVNKSDIKSRLRRVKVETGIPLYVLKDIYIHQDFYRNYVSQKELVVVV